jgi:hypothetical protein
LNSSDAEAAGKFLAILPTLRSAVLKLKPTKYETTNEGKSVSWMQFSVSVTAPASFQPVRTRHKEHCLPLTSLNLGKSRLVG